MKTILTIAAATLISLPILSAGPMKETIPMEEPVEQSDWWFRLAPYAWLTAAEGDLTVRGIEVPVDVSFSDTLDTLDMAAMGLVEFGKGRWGFGTDVIYGNFSDDTQLGGRLFKSARVDQTQWTVTPRLTYRVIDTDDYMMDLVAGARWTSVDLGFTLRRAAGGQSTISSEQDWWDPIVGVRGRADFSEKCFLQYSALVGGFGVSSDFLWDAFLGLGYQWTSNLSTIIGYRGLGVDYEDGGFGVDTITHGLVLGGSIEF